MINIKNAPRILYIVNALKNLLFILPVLMLFYGYKNVSMGDFFLIQGISYLVVFFSEIPTGYIADLFSRKQTVITSLSMWVLGYLTWILGEGFFCILTGELLFGLACALSSGAIDAYLYDLLKKNNKEKNFHKKLAKFSSAEDLGLIFSTTTGSILYQQIGAENTILLSITALIIAIALLFTLPDVPESRRKVAKNTSKMQDIINISKSAIKNKEIKWLMLFPATCSALTLILMWGLQPIMIKAEVPVYLFGFILGINAFMRLTFSSISGKLLEKLGLNKIIQVSCIILVVASTSALVASTLTEPMVYLFLLCTIIGSASTRLTRTAPLTLINHRIQSDERATVLSVNNMVSKLFGALCLILLKPLFDYFELPTVFIITSTLLIPILISAIKLSKMKIKA